MLLWSEIILRLFLASLLGAIIGLERERKDWAAGMRTHMLVCLGSALAMLVSTYGFNDVLKNEHIALDPSRVAAQVISGIGFIGAGTILFLKDGVVRGLTTASGLWTVAAIGLAAGGGMYFAAAVATALGLVILWVLAPIERRLSERLKGKNVRIVMSNAMSPSQILSTLVVKNKTPVSHFSFEKEGDNYIVDVRFHDESPTKWIKAIEIIKREKAVKEVVWNHAQYKTVRS
ncbi:MAG TPA: MgtC/SapB family protein [Turneriella sp.]|nr:MgtC/SapB family protein [Turneriella sp.]